MTQSAVAAPQWTTPAASERLRLAWQERHATDYVFRFSTALAWFVVTGGLYGGYVLYQLVRRSRDHNRRRLELLDAATAFAWEQARHLGLAEELRPSFERISEKTRALNELTAEFREPTLWAVLGLLSGIAHPIAWTLLDRDLVVHGEAEHSIETELASIYARLGQPITPPGMWHSKRRHSVGGRIAATIASVGIYAIWWVRDVMNDGNAHFEQNWAFEDDLARASRALMAA